MLRRAISPQSSLGPHLIRRLATLAPTESVRVIVALGERGDAELPAKRLTTEERNARIAATREVAMRAFDDIDAILRDNGGRRLGDRPTALGTITVEATAKGVHALANSQHVAAILDDQPVRRIQ